MKPRFPNVPRKNRIPSQDLEWADRVYEELQRRYRGRPSVAMHETGLPKHLCSGWFSQGYRYSISSLPHLRRAGITAGIITE